MWSLQWAGEGLNLGHTHRALFMAKKEYQLFCCECPFLLCHFHCDALYGSSNCWEGKKDEITHFWIELWIFSLRTSSSKATLADLRQKCSVYILFLESPRFHLDVMRTHQITTDMVFNFSKTGHKESKFISKAVRTAPHHDALCLGPCLIHHPFSRSPVAHGS